MNAHCTCMAGMGATCNHVAAALFRLEAAMRLGLSNTSCTAKPCEWLPNRKEVMPCKVKDMNLNRDDFSKRGKSTKKFISTPKKNYNPMSKVGVKPLTFHGIVDTLGDLVNNTVLSTAIPKPKIDFVREILSERPILTEPVVSIDDVLLMSSSKTEFFQKSVF